MRERRRIGFPPVDEPFEVEVERRDDAVVVTPVGELDLASVDHLEREIAAQSAGAGHLVLSLASLRFIDTSGMRLVLTQQAACAREGRRFTLVAGPPEVQRLFALGGVLDRLPFAESVDDAVRNT
jgi:anti-sigma B factor antagonist